MAQSLSNTHDVDASAASRAQVQLARDMHASVRAHAGLEDDWSGVSESLRLFYVRMAMRTEGRRAEFFRC